MTHASSARAGVTGGFWCGLGFALMFVAPFWFAVIYLTEWWLT